MDSSISRDILQAIEHSILWEEMNALVSERFRVSFINVYVDNECDMIINELKVDALIDIFLGLD